MKAQNLLELVSAFKSEIDIETDELCRVFATSTSLTPASQDSQPFPSKSTLGIMLDGLTIKKITIGSPAHCSKQLAKGDVLLKVDGTVVTQNNVRKLLLGCDAPGTTVILTVQRSGSQGPVKDVKLSRMSTDHILDERHLLEIFTCLQERASYSNDTVALEKIEEGLLICERMCMKKSSQLSVLVEKARNSQRRAKELLDKVQHGLTEETMNGAHVEANARRTLDPAPNGAAPSGAHAAHSRTENGEEEALHRDEAACLAADELLRPQLVFVPQRCHSAPSNRQEQQPERSRRRSRLGNASPQSWSPPPSEPGGVGGVGMLIRRHDGAGLPVVVEHLTPGGPAALSGLIRPRDRLLAVDGRDVAPLPTGAIAALIAGPEGTYVSLTLRRAAAPAGGEGALTSLLAGMFATAPPPPPPPPYPAVGAAEDEPGLFVVTLLRALVQDPGLVDEGVLGI